MNHHPDQSPIESGAPLTDLRERINSLDSQIVRLLNKRAEISIKVGQIKSRQQDSIFKPFREKDILETLVQVNPGPLPSKHLQNIYREILSSSRSLQRPQQVVYLGPEGTFSYFAGLYYLGKSADFFPCPELGDIFKTVRSGQADLGIIPLENSLQGTVGQSLDLFLRYEVFIQAEIYYKICHSLLTSDQDQGQITIVYSHPQALQQCTYWLKSHLPEACIVPVESTAAAAKLIQDQSDAAAIAHPALAQKYGLHIFKQSIEDLPENWTRFLIIGPEYSSSEKRDKTSLLFTLPDQPGSLARVLELLAQDDINMKKLESRPLRGERWQYVFFVDVECDLKSQAYYRLMENMKKNCHSLRLLGSYPNGPQLDVNCLKSYNEIGYAE